jgi:hypothetical protein
VGRIVRTYESQLGRACVWASRVVVLCLFSTVLNAQTPVPAAETERPLPILTGNAGFFTNVNGGETELVPSITPVLLVPLGDRWLSNPGLNSQANSNAPTRVDLTAARWSKKSTICNWTTSPTAI